VFDGVRVLPGLRVAVAVLAYAILCVVTNFALFRSRALDGVGTATGGLVTPTLVVNLGLLLVVVVALLVAWGRARAFDLGFRRGTLGRAGAVVLGAWALLHGVTALGASVADTPIGAPRPSGGALVAQVFGNALFEEVFFRGVLFVQLVLFLRRGRPAHDVRATWFGLLASQTLFAVLHVPNRLSTGAWESPGAATADLATLFVAGVAFAAVFLRTRNLLVAVGLHALANAPTLVLAGPEWAPPVGMLASLLACLALGPRLGPRR
jgi:hypothetical protein